MGVAAKRGASGQLVMTRDLDVQNDLQRLADEVAVRGNVMVGTEEQRLAAEANPALFGLREGMVWREISYENYRPDYTHLSDRDTTDWEWRTNAWMLLGTNWWVFSNFRDASQRAADDQAANRYTYLASVTSIGNALPGDWIIHTQGRWFPAEPNTTTIGYLRILINGRNSQLGDIPYNLTDEKSLAQTIPIIDHPGGLITVEMQVNPVGVTGRIWNRGTGIVLEYKGPRRNYPKFDRSGFIID